MDPLSVRGGPEKRSPEGVEEQKKRGKKGISDGPRRRKLSFPRDKIKKPVPLSALVPRDIGRLSAKRIYEEGVVRIRRRACNCPITGYWPASMKCCPSPSDIDSPLSH